jgi:hypothetical protein
MSPKRFIISRTMRIISLYGTDSPTMKKVEQLFVSYRASPSVYKEADIDLYIDTGILENDVPES